MTETPPSRLPENYHRAVRSYLMGVERDLDAIEDMVEGKRSQGIFAYFVDTLTTDQTEAFRQWLALMRSGLRRARDRLGLDPSPQKVSGTIGSHLSTMWLALEESTPKRLRGYGALSPGQEALLDEVISDLLARLGRSR